MARELTDEERDDLCDEARSMGASEGILYHVRRDGILPVRLGDNGQQGGEKLTLWRYGDVRVIQTGGDDVWEESDPHGFADLLTEIIMD